MTQTIAAWSIRRYGAAETLAPVTRQLAAPKAGEVLIAVRASAVTRADGMMRSGTPRWTRPFLGLRRPRNDLVGTCFSGEVIATGPGAGRFAVGDQVFGEAGLSFGANASHICVAEDAVIMPKPAALTHEEAAVMCDGPLTSLNFLREIAALRPGEKVLILGASGSLGSAAVQIAAAMGADVTGTCSTRNTGLVAELGANEVIDYTATDPLRGDRRYDVIYDTLGITRFGKARRALTKHGRYVCPVLSFGLLGAMLRSAVIGRRKARFSATGMLKPEALRPMLSELFEMVDNGRLAPVMDRTYPFDSLIEAHRYMDGGHKRGNVVVV